MKSWKLSYLTIKSKSVENTEVFTIPSIWSVWNERIVYLCLIVFDLFLYRADRIWNFIFFAVTVPIAAFLTYYARREYQFISGELWIMSQLFGCPIKKFKKEDVSEIYLGYRFQERIAEKLRLKHPARVHFPSLHVKTWDGSHWTIGFEITNFTKFVDLVEAWWGQDIKDKKRLLRGRYNNALFVIGERYRDPIPDTYEMR